MKINQDKVIENALSKTTEGNFVPFLPFKAQFFGGEGEGDDGGADDKSQSGNDDGGSGGSDDKTSTTDSKTKGNEDNSSDTKSKSSKENLFTQEDVNNVVSKETKSATEKLLKQLGVKDVKSAKDGLAKFKKMQEDQMSDQEKLAQRATELEEESNTKDETISNLEAKVAVLSNNVKPESVDDVTVLAKNLVNDDTDMDAAVKKVIEKYPQFVREAPKDEEKANSKKKPKFSEGDHKTSGAEKTEGDKWINSFAQAFGTDGAK